MSDRTTNPAGNPLLDSSGVVSVSCGHSCTDEILRLKAELERAIETRENANAVSVRVEVENRRLKEEIVWLREALHTICGLTHQDIDEEPFWRLVSRIHDVARRAVDLLGKETL